ncbi:hypothetical protein ABHV46_10790 [Asaia sp. BMEF1]|uniref:hypothetical protein n=1 Tax=Asaia sp. BMEF1 TaxID=3155932 RepID=UPI003F661292
MGALTDWITAISTAATTIGGAAIFWRARNEPLPLIEPDAYRFQSTEIQNLIRVTLRVTNKLPEKLQVRNLKLKHPRRALLHAATHRVTFDGLGRELPVSVPVDFIDYEYSIPKCTREGAIPECEQCVIFYVSDAEGEAPEIVVSFLLSSSALTIKNRRLTVRAKVQTL